MTTGKEVRLDIETEHGAVFDPDLRAIVDRRIDAALAAERERCAQFVRDNGATMCDHLGRGAVSHRCVLIVAERIESLGPS